MKKSILFLIVVCSITIVNAQTKPAAKQKSPQKTEMEKAMEEAMKGMNPEEKMQMQEAMKMAKEMEKKGAMGNIPTETNLKIPKKQTQLLSKIPVLSSQQQYSSYLLQLLTECKRNVQPSIIKEVDQLILKYSNNIEALINIGPALFLKKNPAAAVYASLKTAMTRPDDVLLQDNLAVILHQTGYPQKALPILQFIATGNNYPLILNNIGQSFLSLGDTANARKFFMASLKKDPDHCEANCGMALLLIEAGKKTEATAYIIKSLKNGYTETADALITKHKIKLKFSDIKQKVPEYFNPQKYKPVPPAYTMEMVEPTEALRTELHETMRLWVQKNEQVNAEQNAKIEKESMLQIADRTRGFISNAPFAKKAKLMVNLIGIEYYEFASKDYKNKYLPIQKGYYAQMEKALHDMYGGNQKYDNEYEECVKKIEILNSYLQLTAKNHEAYQRETLPNIYEWVNQSLYWWFFLANKEQYKIYFHNYISDFFEAIHDYDQMQVLYPTPLWITTNCKNVKEPIKTKSEKDSLEIYCPINIKIPIMFGSYKQTCEGMEIEGGELLMLGFEENYKTGEFSFAFGLGVEARLAIFSAGTKGQMFFKFNKDFSPIDCGMKFETGGEANVLGLTIEEKMVGIMGMTSGIHVDAISAGKTTNIFEMDPGN